jgi:MFS family permease
VPRRILVDTAPLRESRDFRLLFTGEIVGTLGAQLTTVAIPFQVYHLTRSSLQVGLVSVAQLVPLILGAFIGGSLGDAVDRRTLLMLASGALALTSGGLAVNALAARPSLAAIYVISALAGGLTGFFSTASYATVATLVDHRHLSAAYAFVQIIFQVGTVAGPALAGLLIGVVHVWWVFGIDAIAALVVVAAVAGMAPIPPVEGASRPGIGSFVEGLRFLRGRPLLQGVFLIDINAMVFGMPRALFPALTATRFHGGAATLGLLYAAPGAGALLGAATTGWVASIRRQARVITGAVMAWGAAIAAFGFSHVLAVSLVLLAVAGAADVISAVLRSTVLQSNTPEEFRSRISSIQIAVVQGGPRLGDLEAGAVATAVNTGFSVVSGGLACIAGAAVLTGLMPGFRRYRARVAGDPGDGPAGASIEFGS